MQTVKHVKKKGGRPRLNNPWEPDERDMAIYAKVCAGQTLTETAKQFDITHPRVHVIVQKIDNWLAPQLMGQIREIKANHTTRLMHVYVEAMAAWERSKLDETTYRAKENIMGKETMVTHKGQAGNSSFLSEARAALNEIRDIWGANAPLQIEYSGEVRVAGRDISEARSELLERIQRLTEASQN